MNNWISVDEELPAIGESVILFANGAVQRETFYLDAGDSSDYHIDYFWVNNHKDCTEESYDIVSGQKWMPLPEPPSND